MGKAMRALGLMSGTSMDGIDAALVETDGDLLVKRGPSLTIPYNLEQRALLAEAVAHAGLVVRREDRPGVLGEAERMVTELHAAAVSAFLRQHGVARSSLDVIGFHGQTVLHRPLAKPSPSEVLLREPPRRLTVQLGDGERLAELTGIDVVYDLRAADAANGGEGAPLVPVYHRALFANRPERPIALLNIGGVANVTWIGRDGEMLAFDTGPGSALIDDWMGLRTGEPYDRDGATAAAGRVEEEHLRDLMMHPFFAARPPKSLDRNAFQTAALGALATRDGAATLTAFTASAVARSLEHMPEVPQLWVVAGGGRRNRTLMQMIAERLACALVPAEAVGLDGDSLEAEAWAYLAVRSLNGLPITFPGTTGVPLPLTGGVLARSRLARSA